MTKLTITDLLKEVMQTHADPQSAEYNECDKHSCLWCENAKRELEEMSKREQTNQHIVELVVGVISFSQHHHTCGLLNRPSSNTCTCGLDDLRAEIKKVKEPTK